MVAFVNFVNFGVFVAAVDSGHKGEFESTSVKTRDAVESPARSSCEKEN